MQDKLIYFMHTKTHFCLPYVKGVESYVNCQASTLCQLMKCPERNDQKKKQRSNQWRIKELLKRWKRKMNTIFQALYLVSSNTYICNLLSPAAKRYKSENQLNLNEMHWNEISYSKVMTLILKLKLTVKQNV